jgi:hypothetical protein
MMKHKQPAQLSYFFHGGFVDMGNVISGAFKYCGENISDSADNVSDAWSDFSFPNIFDLEIAEIFTNLPIVCKIGFYIARLIFSATITPLICILITIFQVSLLLALFLAAVVLFVIVFLLDKIYCMINAIVSHCPLCQSKFTLPIYICPKCGAKHDRLYPGIYGILNRTCQCGAELPTIFFNGRHRLEAQCPHCKCNIKDGGLHASWLVPVVGGPSSGKTCYINMAMMSLQKNAYSRYGLRFEHEKNGLDEYEENARNLSNGYLPPKTTDLRLKYYQFTLTYKNTTKQQISLCDVAGELFDVNAGGNEIEKQTGFRYVNAFMLIIDPLSIPEYRGEVSKTIDLSGYNSGSQRIDEMLDTFVRTLQNMFSINAKDMLNTDVAVVFTKADIPELDKKIGESAVFKTAKSLDKKTRYETMNNLCEKFLREYNEDNFLNGLKSRFKSRQFFACSALGHVMNGQPFVSSNVDEPLLWLVGKRSGIINDVIKKGGK